MCIFLYQVENPLEEMQKSMIQQKASIKNLQATFEENFKSLQNQLSAFTQSFGETYETVSTSHENQSMKKEFKQLPASSSLTTSLSEL